MTAQTMTGRQLPEFPLRSVERRTDVAEEYARLAAGAPVTEVRLPSGRPAWLIVGYREVRTALTDPRFSRNEAVRDPGGHLLAVEAVGTSILNLDPPAHTRLRRVAARGFTEARIAALRPRITEMVGELLDDLAQQHPDPVDLCEGFCKVLPVRVIGEILGVPPTDRYRIEKWRDGLDAPITGTGAPDTSTHAELLAYIDELVAERRERPQDDLLSVLARAGEDGEEEDVLTDREIAALGGTLLVAGFENTVAQLGLVLREVLTGPDGPRGLPQDEEALAAEVEELIRRLPIGDYGGTLARKATEDVELGGVSIKAGDIVIAAVQAANFDPEAFADPRRHDPVRDTVAHHLTFGYGVHRCLGAPVARIELQESLKALRDRFPGMRLAVPAEELRFHEAAINRRLVSLPVVW
ncbi:cytochrome P450 [Streptomyces sp. NPDC003758]|uniref:Cytochrome P450 n=1 Tax=Streptomyces cynarae TaxID=2981134 RepID=A0ABY6E0S8_9ACTN|nr:cytochrome P450 [Streptomyces cynarae]UXY19847.1 cytochrome P450 [Streptomyces cynarae]